MSKHDAPSCTIRLHEHTYTAQRPTIGQFMDIENLRLGLAEGRYEEMLDSRVRSFQTALDLVDTLAHFSILLPQLKEQLNYKSFRDVPMAEADVLVKAYKEQFLPWYTPQLRQFLGLEPLPTAPADNHAPAAAATA